MKHLISVALIGLTMLFTSCGAFKSYVANYSVGLSSVESPSDAKKQFGDTKVVNFDEDGINKFRYEDDYINITWYVSSKQFNFLLKNKSNHTMKINWDDISYVDTDGKVGRVMHAGVKYTERNSSQPSTTIPKGASISDILLPTENVYFVSGQYGGWREGYLIPSVYSTVEAFNSTEGATKYVGKTMTIMMPIMIQNVQNDYTFKFNVEKLLNEAK